MNFYPVSVSKGSTGIFALAFVDFKSTPVFKGCYLPRLIIDATDWLRGELVEIYGMGAAMPLFSPAEAGQIAIPAPFEWRAFP